MTEDTPEYTPRKRLEGDLTNISGRKDGVRAILNANRKAPKHTIHYLQGYYDALDLVETELRQVKDAEIMGITPCDCE